jgi:hypothetical protein
VSTESFGKQATTIAKTGHSAYAMALFATEIRAADLEAVHSDILDDALDRVAIVVEV